jgi:PKD repeat protein
MKKYLAPLSGLALLVLLAHCTKEKEEVQPAPAQPAPLPMPKSAFMITGIQETYKGIKFTNSSQNAESYFWQFADGATSTEASPVHAFTKAGAFRVRLRATGANGQDTTSLRIEVARTDSVEDYLKKLEGRYLCKVTGQYYAGSGNGTFTRRDSTISVVKSGLHKCKVNGYELLYNPSVSIFKGTYLELRGYGSRGTIFSGMNVTLPVPQLVFTEREGGNGGGANISYIGTRLP